MFSNGTRIAATAAVLGIIGLTGGQYAAATETAQTTAPLVLAMDEHDDMGMEENKAPDDNIIKGGDNEVDNGSAMDSDEDTMGSDENNNAPDDNIIKGGDNEDDEGGY